MEIVLSAIAIGGVVGVANQYMCLLIVSVASRIGWIELSAGTQFMESWYFIAIVAVFWFVTVAPAYFPLVAPGLANVVNSVINFISGFLVPVSSALVALGAVGVITNLHPDAEEILRTLGLFDLEAGISSSDLVIMGGGALVGTTLTSIKAVTKPALSAATGTLGHVSAPTIATLENVASFVLMGIAFILAKTDPRLLVGFLALLIAFTVGLFIYALSRIRLMATNMGQFIRLVELQPTNGFAVFIESLIWGSGNLITGNTNRGVFMLIFWIVYVGLSWVVYSFSVAIPLLLFCTVPMSVILFVGIGLSTAKKLLATFEVPEEV